VTGDSLPVGIMESGFHGAGASAGSRGVMVAGALFGRFHKMSPHGSTNVTFWTDAKSDYSVVLLLVLLGFQPVAVVLALLVDEVLDDIKEVFVDDLQGVHHARHLPDRVHLHRGLE